MRKQLVLTIFLLAGLIACQSPMAAPTATVTPLPPATIAAPQSLVAGPLSIPGAAGQAISAEVQGTGDTAIVFANMSDDYSGVWLKLIDALNKDKFTLVTFNYTTPERDAARADIDAALKFLEDKGFKQTVCVGASLGTIACTHAAKHPGLIGLVFMSGPASDTLAGVKYPKLFVVAEGDGDFTASTQAMYDAAAEPKTIKIFPGYAHGAAMFLDSSLDLAPYIADFLNKLP